MKNFKYKIIETMDLNEGISFIESLPLKKRFSRKHIIAKLASVNPCCVCCRKKGVKFCLGVDSGGGKHWDLYTDDDIALTMDHIIPRSKGGKDVIENIQIMCLICNNLKSSDTSKTDVLKAVIDYEYDNNTSNEVTVNLVQYPWFRIGYWKRMNCSLFNKLKEFIEEQEIFDEDCGKQYSYHYKKALN